MIEEKFVIGSNDVDCFYDLKVSSLFMLFQEAAMRAMEEIGADSNYLKTINLDWIITNMAVEIYKLPKFHDQISVITYPGDDMAFLYPRYFFIKDKNGDILAKSVSIWGLLDTKFRHLSLNRDAVKKQTPEHMDGELAIPRKLLAPETFFKDKRKIYYSEIDLNGHLNNCSYIKILVDLKNKAFYEKHSIKTINVWYQKELSEGDEVDIYLSKDERYVEIKKGNDLCFTAEIIYQDK